MISAKVYSSIKDFSGKISKLYPDFYYQPLYFAGIGSWGACEHFKKPAKAPNYQPQYLPGYTLSPEALTFKAPSVFTHISPLRAWIRQHVIY